MSLEVPKYHFYTHYGITSWFEGKNEIVDDRNLGAFSEKDLINEDPVTEIESQVKAHDKARAPLFHYLSFHSYDSTTTKVGKFMLNFLTVGLLALGALTYDFFATRHVNHTLDLSKQKNHIKRDLKPDLERFEMRDLTPGQDGKRLLTPKDSDNLIKRIEDAFTSDPIRAAAFTRALGQNPSRKLLTNLLPLTQELFQNSDAMLVPDNTKGKDQVRFDLQSKRVCVSYTQNSILPPTQVNEELTTVSIKGFVIFDFKEDEVTYGYRLNPEPKVEEKPFQPEQDSDHMHPYREELCTLKGTNEQFTIYSAGSQTEQ